MLSDNREGASRRADDAPTALFTSQNLVTIGAVRTLQELGLHDRVAAVGFDDFPLAELVQPRATVVAQDLAAIGRTARPVELIRRRLGRDPTRQPERVTWQRCASGACSPV